MRTSLSTQKVTTAAAGPIVALRSGSARDIRVFEVGISAVTAAAGEVGLGRPAAAGVTPGTATGPIAAGNSYDSASVVGTTIIDASWATPPTAPTVAWKRFQLPATIGAGVIWTFPTGIVVPTSGTIVLWQFSAAAVTYDVYFDFDE